MAPSSSTKLGTLEFGSILNGDDAILATTTLKRFVTTVQQERVFALCDNGSHNHEKYCVSSYSYSSSSSSSDDDEGEGEEESDDDTQNGSHPTKRKSRSKGTETTEDWKIDTKSYNVPFVGTSVGKGSTGTIRPHTWPTGFLEAYLSVSPHASELLGPDVVAAVNPFVPPDGAFHRDLIGGGGGGGRASVRLHVCFLNALAELLTCAVPMGALRTEIRFERIPTVHSSNRIHNDTTDSNNESDVSKIHNPIVSRVMKDHFPRLLKLLDTETTTRTSSSNSSSSSSHSTRKPPFHKKRPLVISPSSNPTYKPQLLPPSYTYNLTTPILNLFTRLTSTSNGTAREIARGLDSPVIHSSTLSKLLHPPPPSSSSSSSSVDTRRNNPTEERTTRRRKTTEHGNDVPIGSSHFQTNPTEERRLRLRRNHALDTRTACLRLATVLLNTGDSVVASYVTAAGGVHNKTKAGIVYVALRKVLLYESFGGRVVEGGGGGDGTDDDCTNGGIGGKRGKTEREHERVVYGLLRTVRQRLLEHDADAIGTTNGGGEQRYRMDSAPISNRAMMDLFKGEPLDLLTRVSLRAPPQPTTTTNDDDDPTTSSKTTGLDLIALECQSIVHLLLTSPRSPFLLHLHKPSSSFETPASRLSLQQLGRCISTLIADSTRPSTSSRSVLSVPTRDFLVDCFSRTPVLLCHFFRHVNVDSEPTPTFRCLASYEFLRDTMDTVQDYGTVEDAWRFWNSSVVGGNGEESNNNNNNNDNNKDTKNDSVVGDGIRASRLLSFVLPTKLTKNILSKALQVNDVTVVYQGLKLLVAILKRVKRVRESAAKSRVHSARGGSSSSSMEWIDRLPVVLNDALQKRLPDVQVLLAVRSKHDPFPTDDDDNNDDDVDDGSKGRNLCRRHRRSSPSANGIITMLFCEALKLYAETFEPTLRAARFDRCGLLLPDGADAFVRAGTALQCRLLRTLGMLLYGSETSDTPPPPPPPNSVLKAVTVLIQIMLKAKSNVVYDLARDLTFRTVSAIVGTQSTSLSSSPSEVTLCLNYEITLWLDGMTPDLIPIFYKLLVTARKTTVQHAVMVSQSWRECFFSSSKEMPSVTFSTLLTTAVAGIVSDPSSFPGGFVLLVCQIATKMFLFQDGEHILPLAAFLHTVLSRRRGGSIHGGGNNDDDETDEWNGAGKSVDALYRYAEAIVTDSEDRWLVVSRLTSVCFGKEQFHSILTSAMARRSDDNDVDDREFKRIDNIVGSLDAGDSLRFLRQCLQFTSSSSTEGRRSVAGCGNRTIMSYIEKEIVPKLLVAVVREPKHRQALEPILNRYLTQLNRSIPRLSWFLIAASSFAATSSLSSSSLPSPSLPSHRTLPLYLTAAFESEPSFDTTSGRNGILPLLPPVAFLRHFPELRRKWTTWALQYGTSHRSNDDSKISTTTSASSSTVVFRALLRECLNAASTTTTTNSNNDDTFAPSLPTEAVPQALFPIADAFALWKDLCEDERTRSTASRYDSDLCQSLEDLMATVLVSSELYGTIAAKLFICICDADPKAVVDLAFHRIMEIGREDEDEDGTESKCTSLKTDRKGHNFLSSLLIYDPSVFFIPLSSCITINSSRDASSLSSSLWNERWDDIASVIVQKSVRWRGCWESLNDGLGKDLFSNFINAVCERAVVLMEKVVRNNSCRSTMWSFETIFTVLPFVMGSDAGGDIGIGKLWSSGATFSNRMRKIVQGHDLSAISSAFFRFLRKIAVHSRDVENNVQYGTFYVSAVEYTCTVLFKVTSKSKHNSGQKYATSEEVLLTIYSLLKGFGAMVRMLLDSENVLASSLKRLVVYCLKHGINPDCIPSFSSLCLKTVRCLLMVVFSSTGGTVVEYSEKNVFSPHQVHAMVTSHSGFCSFLLTCNDDDGDNNPRNDLISLLICCVHLDNGDAIKEIEKDIVLTLFRVHGAGLGKTDRLLRRLVNLYELHEQLPRLHANEFRWGNLPESSWEVEHNLEGTDHGQHWEWFIQGLDIRRVRLTLANFPMDDTNDFDHGDIESPTDSLGRDTDADFVHNERTSIRDDMTSIDRKYIDIHATENKSQHSYGTVNEGTIISDKEQAERYSPSFLIPLLLNVLEAFALKIESADNENKSTGICLEPERQNDMNSKDKYPSLRRDIVDKTESIEETPNLWRLSFAKIAYRLSKKGMISVALACLSSRCRELRQTAAAVLFFFLKALRMNESVTMAVWRERPQLLMIIDSVQRGLAIRRAAKLSKEATSDTGIDLSCAFVPMLPAVNSLFLARSALILTKPVDNMYPAINRFFLRLENHGAHEDCFSLPAFVSLYCSTADGIGRARTERQWALNLLKNGVIDEFSYKVTSRRHAPELLLTSFESFLTRRRSNDEHDESEGLLLLSTIQTLVENGGILSFHHLICSVGLLSWIKGVLQSSLSKHRFITIAMKHKIVTLLQCTIDVTIQNYTEAAPKTLFESDQLGKILMQMWFDSIGCGINSSKILAVDVSFASCVCKILWSLRELDQIQWKKDSNGLSFEISHSGIPLEQGVALLDMLKGESMTLCKAVGSLCYLPTAASENEHKTAVQLCITSLRCILVNHNQHVDRSIYSHVLNRVIVLISFFKPHFSDEISLINVILGARHKILHIPEWPRCLSMLVEQNRDQKYQTLQLHRLIERLNELAMKLPC